MVLDIVMCATVVAAAMWYIWDSKHNREDGDGENACEDKKEFDYNDCEKSPRFGTWDYYYLLAKTRLNSLGSGEADK